MPDPMITVEIDTSKLDKAMRLFPRTLKLKLGDAFDHIGKHFLKEFRAKRLSGQMGDEGIRGSVHFFKHFKRTFLVPTGGDINNMGTEIFSDSKVARIHETGGIERPSKGAALSVPFSQERVSQLYTGRGRLRSKYKKPRSLKRTFRIVTAKGSFIFQRLRGQERLRPIYHLEGEVVMKPRLGFFKTWDSQTNWRLNRLNKAVDQTLNEV